MDNGKYLKEYGLIGKKIGHSFSAKYFNDKFRDEKIDAYYSLFPLENIGMLPELLDTHPLIAGLNVTIPYKVEVIGYLDSLSEEAEGIGAVNVIKIMPDPVTGKRHLRGYNSDAYGFSESLRRILDENGYLPSGNASSEIALVLGTGGASRAVVWSLRKLGFHPILVGRIHRDYSLSYSELTPETVYDAKIVVNCTPLGTSPDVGSAPPFPYQYLHDGQICFDLVYNPADTLFMKLCRAHGCIVSNGLEMLHLQAIGAWRIWNE